MSFITILKIYLYMYLYEKVRENNEWMFMETWNNAIFFSELCILVVDVL